MPRPGETQLYRPMPDDFAETFVRVGWDGIEFEVRGHKTTICRWISQYDEQQTVEGKPTLKELRRAHLEEKYAALGKKVRGAKPGRAKRYVLGRTLTAVKSVQVEG